MFNIPSYQGNTNENYFDIASHISQNSYDKTKQNKTNEKPHRTPPNTPENVEKRSPYSLLVGVQTSTVIMEIGVAVSQQN